MTVVRAVFTAHFAAGLCPSTPLAHPLVATPLACPLFVFFMPPSRLNTVVFLLSCVSLFLVAGEVAWSGGYSVSRAYLLRVARRFSTLLSR